LTAGVRLGTSFPYVNDRKLERDEGVERDDDGRERGRRSRNVGGRGARVAHRMERYCIDGLSCGGRDSERDGEKDGKRLTGYIHSGTSFVIEHLPQKATVPTALLSAYRRLYISLTR
jgi:hypothetical protein